MTTARPLSALFADMPSFVRPAHESVMSMNDIIRAVNGRKGRRPLTALKALDRCEEMNLDMDLTKAKVKAFARRLQASSIFTEGDVREVVRMSADRDWCVEDVLSEVRAMLMSAL